MNLGTQIELLVSSLANWYIFSLPEYFTLNESLKYAIDFKNQLHNTKKNHHQSIKRFESINSCPLKLSWEYKHYLLLIRETIWLTYHGHIHNIIIAHSLSYSQYYNYSFILLFAYLNWIVYISTSTEACVLLIHSNTSSMWRNIIVAFWSYEHIDLSALKVLLKTQP